MVTRTLVLVTAVLLVLNACGAATPKDKVVENPTWVVGEWKGEFRDRDADKGTPLARTTAIAVFVANPADKSERPSGTFSFTFPELDNATAKGDFHYFPSTGVMLDVSSSTISLLDKRPHKLDYVLVNSSLTLRNDDIILDLFPGTASTTETPTTTNNPTPTTTTSLGGRWTCQDSSAHTWRVTVATDTSFSIELTQAGAGALHLSGSVALIKDNAERDAVLTVVTSNDSSLRGIEFYPKVQSDTQKMRLVRTERVGGILQAAETIDCNRP